MDEQPQRDLRPPWSRTDRAVPRRIVRPLQQFLHQEIAGGLVLLAATLGALVWANVDSGGYLDLWATEITVTVGDFVVVEDLKHLVNDGLMAIFFLVVGLEVKRELVVGELSGRQAALLPFFAALGGMVLPAAIFVALVVAGEHERVDQILEVEQPHLVLPRERRADRDGQAVEFLAPVGRPRHDPTAVGEQPPGRPVL